MNTNIFCNCTRYRLCQANQIVTMYEASELNDIIKVLDVITQDAISLQYTLPSHNKLIAYHLTVAISSPLIKDPSNGADSKHDGYL